MRLRTCVIIPAYNAAKTLGRLLDRIRPLGLDVVVINDGSTDETAAVASQTGTLVINHLRNHGKGAALRTGFAYALQAGYELVVTMDSDGQHDPLEIPALLEAAAQPGSAIVVGQRAMSESSMPFARRCTNRFMSWLVSRMAGAPMPDSQCGFRVIRREVLATIRLSSRRFDIETEMLLAAARRKWPIRFVPIRTIYERHSSHIRPVVDGLRFFRLVAWIGLRHLVERVSDTAKDEL